MAERIYNRTATGSLDPLVEERFSTENELQALIADHPELLDGEQIRPGSPRRWLLITREKGVAESPDSNARWSVDHLIIDQDAVPTLVEVKTRSNSEIRRTVVGQMLEYAAHAANTWTADELRQAFEKTASENGTDPEESLRELLRSDEETDAGEFWEKVETNLTAPKMRLLFVADEIPDELERVVMFLNAQMPKVEVLAVEIKQFKGPQTQTLVPRVTGRTASPNSKGSSRSRSRLSLESFLDCFTDEETQIVAKRLLNAANGPGVTCRPHSSSFTVQVECTEWPRPVTVAWLYVPEGTWMKTKEFSFGTAILDEVPGSKNDLRETLERWANQFSGDIFTTDVSSKGVAAWSVDYQAAAQHADVLVERLERVISELRSL